MNRPLPRRPDPMRAQSARPRVIKVPLEWVKAAGAYILAPSVYDALTGAGFPPVTALGEMARYCAWANGTNTFPDCIIYQRL